MNFNYNEPTVKAAEKALRRGLAKRYKTLERQGKVKEANQ